MSRYTHWSKAELIARLRELEVDAGAKRDSSAPIGPAPAREETAERLRAILETAVEGIITIDEHGIIEAMNPAAEKTFGFKATEVIGRNVSCLMPTPYSEEHDGYIANYLTTGHARIIGIGREVVGRRKDGSVFPMDLAVSEVRLADRRLFTGFVRDITERKRLEKEILEISDQERRRIGQDLHDGLCQHLAGIELMSQVLEQKLAAKSKSDATRAGELSRHVRDAICQTRALARGLSPVTLDSEGLPSALQELAANAEKMFGIACRVLTPEAGKVRAAAVDTHLYRIAQEAVSNAIKHGKCRDVRIQLEVRPDQTLLTVTDDGTGIPEPPPRNTGMGLRIMEYRAGMIGGALTITRNPHRGTTVLCSVPLHSMVPQAVSRRR